MKSNEVIEKMIEGINKVCDVLKTAYGPTGSNIIIEEALRPFYRVTNDGKLITDAFHFEDSIENIGANILKEVAEKAERDSGDGRKTTSILTQAILLESQKIEVPPLKIKHSLDECLPLIIKSLDEQKKPITVNEIKAVATISSESEKLGEIIQEIYQKIGPEGIIEVDSSNLPETYYEIGDGVRLRNAGWVGAFSSTEPGKAIYSKPKILISKEKIISVNQLAPIYESLHKKGINELVIYCEDIDMSVANPLAKTHLQGGFKTLLIKSPTLWKDWLFEDLAIMTGATPVDVKNGKTFMGLTIEDLGTCDKIVTTKDETRVIGIKDISQHLKNLEEAGLKDDQQKLRASWLNTKVATLKVGANSESELTYVMKKAKDACAASYWALKDGVVEGAGLALNNAITPLVENSLKSIGVEILKVVLQIPHLQIITNLGLSNTDTYYPDELVIDPTLVVKNAITNAISIAGTILTCRGVITLPKHD